MVETETVLDVVPDLVPSQAAPATGKNARRSYQKHGFTQLARPMKAWTSPGLLDTAG
jgi:hypothetical protein